MTWLAFFLLTAIIGVGGYYLCKSAEEIGDSLGVSHNWIGAVLLATVTSMPELIAGVTAIKMNLPVMAVGNALGGNLFNLMFVFALDLMYRKRMLFSEANHAHLLTASLGILMMGSLLFLIILEKNHLGFHFFHLGLTAVIIPLLYLLAMKTLYQFDKKSDQSSVYHSSAGLSRKLVALFSFSALVVIVSGMALPGIGERIVSEHGWNSAFVGTVFMAIATSCPEMAVTIAAIRLNAVNLALSNLLASNIFNLVIISVDDYFYTTGPIAQVAGIGHMLTIVSGILMTALVMVGLLYRPSKRIFNTVSVISLIILGMYVINNLTLFRLKE